MQGTYKILMMSLSTSAGRNRTGLLSLAPEGELYLFDWQLHLLHFPFDNGDNIGKAVV